MCKRFVVFRRLEALMKHPPIDVANVEVTPNYNIAPTQEVLAISRHDEQNHLEKYHWGLVPFWAEDTTIGRGMINARSEILSTIPSFRTAFKWRRCLILADGYYEWKGEEGDKQPMFLTLPDGRPFAFAGLFETWDDRGKEPTPYCSCTILTRQASKSVMPIHNRMPVILKPKAFEAWLSQERKTVQLLQDMIQNQVYTELTSVPVSTLVNSVENNSPENIRPMKPTAKG